METKLTVDNHKRTYRLTWGQHELDVRPYPFSRTGRSYQPHGALVHVSREFGGQWELYTFALYGLALKKDGTVGQQAVEEKFWSFDREKAPRELVEATEEILAFLNDPAVNEAQA